MGLNENLVFNKEDIKFNVDKFESGESNVLLVTGFPGSGKSTLAEKLANKYGAVHIQLDYLTDYVFNDVTKEELLEWGEEGLVDYIKLIDLANNQKDGDFTEESIIALIRNYIKFIITWCKNKRDQKFVIEGYQLYNEYQEGDTHITNCPIIIKGTSGLVSTLRAAKRNDGSALKNFGALIKFIFKDNKTLNTLEKDLLDNKTFADEFKEYESLWDK